MNGGSRQCCYITNDSDRMQHEQRLHSGTMPEPNTPTYTLSQAFALHPAFQTILNPKPRLLKSDAAQLPVLACMGDMHYVGKPVSEVSVLCSQSLSECLSPALNQA